MKKVILLFAFACWTAGTAQAQTVVNVQTPTSGVANHDNPTPKDFSINTGTGLNETYLWNEETNRLQGININLAPLSETTIYMQQTNGRLAFHFSGNYISYLEVKWDGGSWDVLATTTQAHHGWFTPQFSGNNSVGEHELDVRVTLSTSAIVYRKYKVNITEDCSHFYKDNFGNTVTVWGHSAGKKPIVLADGIDQGNTDYAELIRIEASNLADELIANNFSLWVLNCAKGAQDIESNAAMYASLVRYVSGINSSQPVVAAGISMGGQVSRWAVCEAEEHSRPLPVTHWISFDSPHRGAVIDHDLQDFMFANAPTNASLNATASKQLLGYSPFDAGGTVRNAFVNKRNSLNGGNYPQQCISIGVSFSNGLPNPHNNEEWLRVEFRGINTNILWHQENFKVKYGWSETGSFLPALTGNAEREYVKWNEAVKEAVKYKLLQVALQVPIDPTFLEARTIRSENRHPTFVSLKSALDMDEQGNSPFCYTLYSIDQGNFEHHDRVPQDLVLRILGLLQIGTLNDIASGAYYNFGGGEIPSTNNSFDVFGNMYVNGDIGTGSSTNPQAPPAGNSLFRLSTSCNTEYIAIKNGAELLIGSDTRGLKGEFIVRKGTTLTLESGSLLVINNNSKLVIEQGSSLKFHPNAQIILNGANAVLEIRGNLKIMNGATFTVTGGTNGLGKLIFHKDWLPDEPDYVASNIDFGGNFILDGESEYFPHLEIYGNIGLKFSYGLNNVEIKNTKILIDEPSTLCFLNKTTKMENVKVSKAGSQRHGGIKAVNRYQHFRNVDIEFARTGITVFNNGYNGSMLLQDVTVFHSDYGVHAVGGCRISYNKGELSDIGEVGFFGNGILGNSGVRGVEFSKDISPGTKTGVCVLGHTGAVFELRRNSLLDFNIGVISHDNRTDLRCNTIRFNDAGIIASNAHLSLVRNNMSNNSHAWTQHGGTYHIENGLNYFHATDFYFEHMFLAVHQHKYSNPLYAPYANVPQYLVPDAQNAWGKASLTGHSPQDAFTYSRDYYINSAGLYPPPEPIMGKLAQDNPLPYSSFSNTDPSSCPEVNTGSGPLGTIVEMEAAPPAMAFNTGITNGGWGGDIHVPYDNNFSNASLALNNISNEIFDYSTSPDLTAIVSNLSDIIFYPYQMIETQVILVPYLIDDEIVYIEETIEVTVIEEEALASVLMNAYHLLLESVSRAHGVSAYVLEDDFLLFNTVATEVLTVLDELVFLSQSSHFLWSVMPFNLHIDKANLQRFVYELNDAVTTLSTALNYIEHSFQQSIYDRLSCILEAETAIRDSLTLPENIEVNHPCLFMDYEPAPAAPYSVLPLANRQPSVEKNSNITLYPNPATDELFIRLAQASPNSQYMVYDLIGNRVLSGILKGTDSRIDINSLSAGMYIIQINTNNQSFNQKFLVEKR